MCFCFFKLHPSSFYKLVSVFPSTDWLFSKQSFVSPSTGEGSHVSTPERRLLKEPTEQTAENKRGGDGQMDRLNMHEQTDEHEGRPICG